ncbi:MAG TPA: ethanolamine ammonia-lyase subunit EutC [Nitrospirota bacterium]|nr:ethanolamine ammonia-lyase subunit EutC [Nitrospirota bacterium]
MEKMVYDDPWISLRKYTKARIALGRAGTALTTAELLRFRLDHARARDAVLKDMDPSVVIRSLEKFQMPVPELTTRAHDRNEYIHRPDLGRRLSPESAALLAKHRGDYDIALMIADGLSGIGVETNAGPFLDCLLALLRDAHYTLAPLCIIRQGRVAVSDEVGSILGAKLSAILIGERPGLSSPDSMGIYMTFRPEPGLTDERRNCISNIRSEGLAWPAAARKLMYFIRESLRLKLSGVKLKDDEDRDRGRLIEA